MTNNTGNNQAPMKDDPPRKTTNFVAQSEEESRDNFSHLKFKSSDLLVDKVGLHYFQNKISTMRVSPNNSFREGYKMERKLREEATLGKLVRKVIQSIISYEILQRIPILMIIC